MLPDRVSNPGPLTYESGVLPIALRGPAKTFAVHQIHGYLTLRPKQYTRLSKETEYKIVTIYTMWGCDTINSSKCVNNFLSTNPTTPILSSVVSEF